MSAKTAKSCGYIRCNGCERLARFPPPGTLQSLTDGVSRTVGFERGIAELFPSKKNRPWYQISSENAPRVAEDGLISHSAFFICPRCGSRLHFRKPNSLGRCWAFLTAAMLCYLPANVLPIMTSTQVGYRQTDTILSGVQYLAAEGMWPLAMLVFVASIVIPLLKLVVLTLLLISVQWPMAESRVERTRWYRFTEAIGRWSMVDIFILTVFVALVNLGSVVEVHAEAGAIFFGAVVILTMLAAHAFDPRLIWDRAE